MLLKATYGGYELTNHCIIRAIKPTLTAPYNNEFASNSNLSGAKFRKSRFGQIVVSIDITIKQDVMYHRDKLNEILFSREPKQLIISDQPERYLLCIPTGQVQFTSRFRMAEATIQFISPNHYWNSTQGTKTYEFNNGNIQVTNLGTAPVKPSFDVHFEDDCGYLGIVAPNGFISVGNPQQNDRVEVPPTEYAMNEEMHEVDTWTRRTDAQTLIPDYNKISSLGTAKHDQWGILLGDNLTGADRWNGHAYIRGFDQGAYEKYADNFLLKSRVDISNTGNRSATMAMLIVVMDDENVPLMTTSVYDASSDKNELTITFKVPNTQSGKNNHSVIINTAKLPNLNGYITMEKSGNNLHWVVHNDKTQSTVINTKLKVNQKVHIKQSATHAETGHPILKGYHDLTYTIGAIKTGRDGTTAYRVDNGGWAIYWIYERDIVETTKTINSSTPQTIRFSRNMSFVGQRRPSKVFIWQAKWGEGPAYSQFSLNSVVVERKYSTDSIDIPNTFRKGDHLRINNEENEVLLNGVDFTGAIDVDSRFFEIDSGPTGIVLHPSSWAKMPKATIEFESRWL